MRQSLRWGLCALMVGGCARREVRPPPEAFVTLGGNKASYRAWDRVEDLCALDATQFTGEQQALAALLADWLGQTSAPVDGAWDEEHVALLEEGARVLPPALELQRAALEKSGKVGCTFSGLGPAAELNAQAQRRVEAAPRLAEQLTARLALAHWKEALPQQLQAARQSTCAPKPKPGAPPVLYFAIEDEAGHLDWLFCDGSKVLASPGNAPAWLADPGAKKPKKDPDPKLWLDAAAKFPAQGVHRAPKLPNHRPESSEDAASPGE